MAWLRRGEGMVAWGVAAECRTSGADRFADSADWWQTVSAGGRRARRRRRARHRPDLPGQLRLRRRPGRQRAGRAPGGRRHPRRPQLDHRHRPGRAGPDPRARDHRPRRGPAQRRLRRRRDERCRLGDRGRRRRTPHRGRRAGEGRARARPDRHRLRADRRALAAAPAGRALRDVLDLPRRRAVRRDAGAARTPRARPGDLARAGRHHPAYGRRRARRRPRRTAGAVLEGPRGARVRRPLGRRLARAVLLEHERARGALRAAPAQRDAPRHRRRRRRRTTPTAPASSTSPRPCTPRPPWAVRRPRSPSS